MAPPLTVSRHREVWSVRGTGHLEAASLGVALSEVASGGGGRVFVWVSSPTDADDAVAAAAGLDGRRDLLQLRVPLPLRADAPPLEWRPFEPGVDDERWLAVNNRAFHWHPEQGGWDLASLHARMREPWFDPAGFLLHERDGRLAGFCWTKVHADEDPPLGEIYVIGVDPDFQGLGLGRALTVAAMDWLHRERDIQVGMLYVEADNTTAVGLYRSLGFTPHHVDRAYHAVIGSGT